MAKNLFRVRDRQRERKKGPVSQNVLLHLADGTGTRPTEFADTRISLGFSILALFPGLEEGREGKVKRCVGEKGDREKNGVSLHMPRTMGISQAGKEKKKPSQ